MTFAPSLALHSTPGVQIVCFAGVVRPARVNAGVSCKARGH
jgi:hypothetical protein